MAVADSGSLHYSGGAVEIECEEADWLGYRECLLSTLFAEANERERAKDIESARSKRERDHESARASARESARARESESEKEGMRQSARETKRERAIKNDGHQIEAWPQLWNVNLWRGHN